MSRLQGMRTYLVGAIDRVEDRGAAWREEYTKYLHNRNIIVLNPLKKPINIGDESPDFAEICKKLQHEEKYDELTDMIKLIRHVDLRMCDVCDFLTVYIDMNDKIFGTVEEITTAVRQKKPILIVIKQGKKFAPRWLFGMIPHQHIFNNTEEYLSYLDYVDKAENPDTMNRWLFFDLKEETKIALGV